MKLVFIPKCYVYSKVWCTRNFSIYYFNQQRLFLQNALKREIVRGQLLTLGVLPNDTQEMKDYLLN